MRGDTVADVAGQVEGGADFRGTLHVRGARRLRLGLYEPSRNAASGKHSGCAASGDVQREIQEHAPGMRPAVAYRSRNYRADGSGARAVCASIVVLAKQDEHSRKGETV